MFARRTGWQTRTSYGGYEELAKLYYEVSRLKLSTEEENIDEVTPLYFDILENSSPPVVEGNIHA